VDSDAEHSEKDDIVRPPPRKRRKVSPKTLATGGMISRRRTLPNRGDSSSREAGGSSRRPKRQGKRGTIRPPSSREATPENAVATFREWPLGNAILKRVTMDGSSPTFVVQFTWDPCATQGRVHGIAENRSSVSSAQKQRPTRERSTRSPKPENLPAHSKPTSTSRRARYTPEDDAKIRQLKEQGLSWLAIAQQFPGRTAGAIEVRYHTKLKAADASQKGARQLRGYSPAPSPVTDNADGDEEWEVEEICGHRRLDDRGVQLLVKWKGGEKTWEPYENVAETEALDRYEHLHGPVTVNTV
jgi:hypothetical protein